MPSRRWDLLLTPIIIEIISWLDQESLMNLSLVSKQLYNIIRNEPGNKNKIIPVFEVNGSSTRTFACNLRDHFLNNETGNKLQRYHIMRFKDAKKFTKEIGVSFGELENVLKNVQMNGITSLDLYAPSRTRRHGYNYLTNILSNILPELREVHFSNMIVNDRILRKFSLNCPLLEKVTSHNNGLGISSDGSEMRFSNNLKKISINNASFFCNHTEKNIFADFNNHQEMFIFHHCCKVLERVSIQNAKYQNLRDEKISQNILIKFVRNAPPTLRWFRSDLTSDNMTMLRLERPGIELLN
ncbi:MAG: hypothetical protein ACI8RD_014876 [Bacillariaceae sp.]|jgi:hypothetical protein